MTRDFPSRLIEVTGMCQSSSSLPWIDLEGYPGALSDMTPGPDRESGEVVTTEVVVLRRYQGLHSSTSHPAASSSVATTNKKALQKSSAGNSDQQTFKTFRTDSQQKRITFGRKHRVENFVSGRERANYRPQRSVDITRGLSYERRMAYSRGRQRISVDAESGQCCRTSPMFRVPAECVYKDKTDEPKKTRKAYCINIWQEFIYGPSLMLFQIKDVKQLKSVQTLLGQFLHMYIVDIFLYAAFYGTCFMYCLIFNNILELFLYITYSGHLSIHEAVDVFNLNVSFMGSVFQGPSYVFIRFLCKHCNQKAEAKVIMNMMKKMKEDILNSKIS